MVVTGGARLPWYGCPTCNSNLDGFVPPPTWTLVATFDDRPINDYRLEPLRVWHVSRAAARAKELRAEHPDPMEQRALLRRLAGGEDPVVAVALGHELLMTSPTTRRSRT
jgi:hypothetical protein